MNFLFIYLAGFTICGLLHLCLYETKFFNDHIDSVIDQALAELIEEKKDQSFNSINRNVTKTLDIFVTSLFSWLGVIWLLILVLEIRCKK